MPRMSAGIAIYVITRLQACTALQVCTWYYTYTNFVVYSQFFSHGAERGPEDGCPPGVERCMHARMIVARLYIYIYIYIYLHMHVYYLTYIYIYI